MGKTTFLKLEGKANWARVFEDNRDMKGFEGAYEECEGAYTLELVLDAENFDKLKASGSMKKGSIDTEGVKVKFVRKHKGPFPEVSGPPKVLKADNSVWGFEKDGAIGNGSDVEISLSVYPVMKGKRFGTRLDKVVVKNAVAFDDTKRTSSFYNTEDTKGNFDTDEVPF
jgi:hypothetical protein